MKAMDQIRETWYSFNQKFIWWQNCEFMQWPLREALVQKKRLQKQTLSAQGGGAMDEKNEQMNERKSPCDCV